MIIKENYGEEHIRELQSKSHNDPQLIEHFTGEVASYMAVNLIYMAACLKAETPYEPISSFEEYASEQLLQTDLNVLSKMRKAQPMQYAYLVKADRLLKECR